MGVTTIFLAMDPRTTALAFIGALGLIAVLVVGFVLKSIYEQRKYSQAALPSLPKADDPQADMVREPTESAFSLSDLDDELPALTGEESNGTTLDQLPGVELSRSFAPEPTSYEPEENALPTLALGAMTPGEGKGAPIPEGERPRIFTPRSTRQDSLDEAGAQELADDEEDQDFTPVVASEEELPSFFEDSTPEIDKIEADEDELNLPTLEVSPPTEVEEETPEHSLFRNRKPISIPTLEEDPEASDDEPYVGKRRLEAPVPSEETVMKEEA